MFGLNLAKHAQGTICGKIIDETCPGVGLNQQTSDQKSTRPFGVMMKEAI